VEKLTPQQEKQRATGLALGGLAAHLLPEKPRPKPVAPLPRDPIGLAAGGPIAELAGERRREKPPVVSGPRPPRITLGSDSEESDYHLQVILDPRGASVYQVILNKFQEASPMGRPAPGRLTLIPQSDRLASYILYHYDIDSPK